MKTADSRQLFFHDNGAKCTVVQQNALTGVKSSSSKVRIRKIQKLRSGGKQLAESPNKRIQRISKAAHSSRQWTKFGVDNLGPFHSELFCSAEGVWRQNATVSLSTGVPGYLSTVN